MCRSVCPCVQKVYCGKTADWIWMPFEMMSGVVRGLGVLHGMDIVEEEGGSFGDKCGASHCSQWEFCAINVVCREGWRHGSSQITL